MLNANVTGSNQKDQPPKNIQEKNTTVKDRVISIFMHLLFITRIVCFCGIGTIVQIFILLETGILTYDEYLDMKSIFFAEWVAGSVFVSLMNFMDYLFSFNRSARG
ncbi:hypothetical protein VIS19158_11843 [Vibrio scophthalmi LMG 19158]|uniref:Uncharacterized protein n=1 Tax=Vibrio scophthalmi LMG 19158 TaxID=870967 RepID=F9RIF6_9VIBR|nr:hypothetical protein VIS19158_11843 [Vibrio scophthalmi LMG 19158]